MNRARRITLLASSAVAVAVAIALLVALAPGDRPSAAPRPAPDPAVPASRVDISTLVLPFDTYETTPYENQVIEQAKDRLLGDCMRESGLPWTPLPGLTRADTEGPHDRRYGLADPGVAARYGYHLPPLSPARKRLEAVYADRADLPLRERNAAYGPNSSTGGCWKKADERMFRGVERDQMSLLAGHSAQTFDVARRDPRVSAADKRWSACMKKAGHTYTDSYQALSDPAWGKSKRPTARERAVAVADVRCKRETGFLTTWIRVDQEVQNAAVRKNPALFRDLAEDRTAQLALARKILGRS